MQSPVDHSREVGFYPRLSSPKLCEGTHLHLFSCLSMVVELSQSGIAGLRSGKLSGWRLPLATQLCPQPHHFPPLNLSFSCREAKGSETQVLIL